MPTQAEVEEHREAVAALVLLAQADMTTATAGVDLENARRVAAVVRDLFPEIAATYVPAVSVVSADWYEVLRFDADVPEPFTASVLDVPDADDLQDAVGDMLTPLFDTTETPTVDATTTVLDGLAETLVTSADRQTVQANAAQDRARPVYARHASANACAFCRMLATRGADYASEESALRVVLGRGSRKLGEKYHDWCRCTAVPEWHKGTYEEAPYVADWRDAYTKATRELGGAKDVNAVLAHMRQTLAISH